jgi:RNA polymerase sigma-70 factor (ECF subfamily)
MEPDDATTDLLRRWHAGEDHALTLLVERDLPWIRAHVHRRLGALLRRRDDTDDVVQLTMVQVLRDGPRFVVNSQREFRGLVARIVENVVCDEMDHYTARRRDVRREAAPCGSDAIADLRGIAAAATSPSRAAAANELRTLVRLALELLPGEARTLIVLREYQGHSFAQMGARLGMTEKTAQRRFARALHELVEGMDRLRRGRIADALNDGH